MKKLINSIYLRAPFTIKRIFANIEAIRRDYYRKYTINSAKTDNIDIMQYIQNPNVLDDVNKLNDIVTYASDNVDYYKELSIYEIKSINDFEKIPILTKEIIRNNIDILISNKLKNKTILWKGSSSGSTGTPLIYFRDRLSVSNEQKNYDSYYKYCAGKINNNRVRISGVKITNFTRRKPPYWIYIDKYKQLQCSSFHISRNTIMDYLEAFKKYNVTFATGYPSSWTNIAELMIEKNIRFEGISSIITDSEGLTQNNKKMIESVFGCPVYRTYGLGEVGMFAVDCKNNNYHILPTHYVEIVDINGNLKKNGEEGEIIVTDLSSYQVPYIRYATGDLGIMNDYECGCGLKTKFLSEITGRIEDYIITKDGRKITRLTPILKEAIGIKRSQIIQNSLNEIIINIQPDDTFQPESMINVIKKAKEFLGDMNIEWQVVDQLVKMPSGKIKFIIRNI